MTEARRRALTPRGAILIMVVLGLLFTSVYPLRRYIAVRHEITDLRGESVALDQKLVDLERERAMLHTDEAVEEIARKDLGMVAPGEVPFVIPGNGTDAPPAPRIEATRAEQEPAGPSVFSRWWRAVRSALGAPR